MEIIFADAISDYKNARYVICGVGFDGTSCFRKGSRYAPSEIRYASYNFESYNSFFDVDISKINIYDIGNLEISDNIDKTLDLIYSHAEKYFSDSKIPIMLGGEHSLTFAFVKACKKKFKDITFVVLDAHLDMRKEYEGEKNSHACISRNILDKITKNYIAIGIRSGTKQEYDYVKNNNIQIYSSEYVFENGIKKVLDEIQKIVKGKVYLSIDMDVLDPAYAPGVGTPEPYGLSPRDVRYIIMSLSSYIVGFDIVEISPRYDNGETALLGARLVHDFIAASSKF